MTTPDFLYLALIAVVMLVEHFVLWPSFLRRSQADPGRARLWLWSGWIINLWTQVAAGVALWLSKARAWESLRLVAPSGWRLWVSVVLVLAVAIAYARPAIRIARAKRPKRIKIAGAANVQKLVPHTSLELGWWVVTSLSAGFCEEFVFRGYLIWAFAPLLGLWPAAALSLVVFTLAHAYQGSSGMLAVAILGSLFTLGVLILGSLWPVMALHALVDVGQGLIAWLVFSRARGEVRGEGETVRT